MCGEQRLRAKDAQHPSVPNLCAPLINLSKLKKLRRTTEIENNLTCCYYKIYSDNGM